MRVLVGCPTFEGYKYCLAEYAERVKNLSFSFYDVVLVDNSKTNEYSKKIQEHGLEVIKVPWHDNAFERIVSSRNVLRQKVLDEGYDYLLSLEQDIIPPVDIIEKLLRHKKKCICGVYYKIYDTKIKNLDGTIEDKKILLPLIFKITDDKNKMQVCYPKDLESEQLLKIRASGLGCMLIHKDVLKKISFRYDKDVDAHDDMFFSSDIYDSEFDMYTDTSVKCKHLLRKKGDVFETGKGNVFKPREP
jgi:GT2 family glycosyltransferase